MSIEQYAEYIEQCSRESIDKEKRILDELCLKAQGRNEDLNQRMEVVNNKIKSLLWKK